MPEKVTGYLSTDGTFFNDEDLCRHHDAKLALIKKIQNGVLAIEADLFLRACDIYINEVIEYLTAKKAILANEKAMMETPADEPDTGPLTVEK